jgi:uncharacterized protein (DUF4415 family)
MSENASKSTSKTDWARVSALTDAEIDTSEIPPLDDSFFSQARLRLPPQPLTEVTLHLDPQVLDWFQKQGSSYEELINAALRIYAQAHAAYGGGSEGRTRYK